MRLAIVLALLLVACGPKRPTLPDGRPRFVALADRTVRDDRTGLIWSNPAAIGGPSESVTWDDARAAVAAMNGGARANHGHADWRLPTAGELAVLFSGFWVPRSRIGCALSGQGAGCVERARVAPFVDLAPGTYWSATPARNEPGRMMTVDLGVSVVSAPRTQPGRVLPVRGHPLPDATQRTPLLPPPPLAR